jgi:FixJ family two-component response regulator
MGGPESDVAAALVRARVADEMLWASTRDSLRFRRERDEAVAEAIAAGVPLEQLADELGVLIRDVERMAAAGQVGAT